MNFLNIFSGLSEVKGEKGVRGPKGEQGLRGERGEAGPVPNEVMRFKIPNRYKTL